MVKYSLHRLIKFVIILGLVATSVHFFLKSRKLASSRPKVLPSPTPDELFKVISPSTYKYTLNAPGACKNRTPFLVLISPTAPADAESRHAIRNTWGQEQLVQDVDIVRLFYVGFPVDVNSGRVQRDLERESERYGDIIQMDFLDSYQNLTIKTMMIMNWLASYCQTATYAMKIDADIFLNVPYLVKYLRTQGGRAERDYITGSVITDGVPRRARNSKWYLSEDAYPELAFPPYVSGAGYVFSVDLAGKISWASKFVRPIPLEDVYVGLCLRVLRVRPVYSQTLFLRNLFEIRRMEYDRCVFANRVIVTGFSPRQLLNIWHDFQNAQWSC